MEKLLGLFDQSQADKDDVHVLSIADEDYPEKFQPVIRRLMKAICDPKIRDIMQVEDDYLGELESLERAIAKREDLLAKKDGLLARKDTVIAEKEGVIAEKDTVIAENKRALAEMELRLERAIAVLVASGIFEAEARRMVLG